MNFRDNRNYEKKITFKTLWLKEQFTRLRKIYDPEKVSNDDLKKLLLSEYDKRRTVEGRFYLNTDNTNHVMTIEGFVDYFLNNPYILSGYSVLYKDHDSESNIGSSALKFLLDSRKHFKEKMEASTYGSDEYTYYKILQLTFKVLANSYYGILGERNSIFYNPHIQNSITMTSQDLITATIVGIENYLSNDMGFDDFDDILVFITAILEENPNDSILKYIDNPVSHNDVIVDLINRTEKISPKMEDKLNKIVNDLSLEDVNRIYYKNRILEFINNSNIREKFKIAVANPDMDRADLVDTILKFTYVNIVFEERYKRAIKRPRKSVLASDTDSVFVTFSNYVSDTLKLLELPNDTDSDMNVMNIFIEVVDKAMISFFEKLTTNMGIKDEYKPIINLKNEFIYRRLLFTRNKKAYAGIIVSELGRKLNKPVPDIKGLSIKKTTVAKELRRKFTNILVEDILTAQTVKLSSIIRKFDDVSIEVEESLRKGETKYLLPKSIEKVEGYKDPSTMESVRGMLVWNAIEPESQIVPPEKIDIIKLNVYDVDDPRLLKLRDTHPQKYQAIMKVVFNEGNENPAIDISRFGFSVVAVPKSSERIPDYLLPFIDYKTMTTNNISNGYILLESLGVYTDEVKTTKYKSNIIEI